MLAKLQEPRGEFTVVLAGRPGTPWLKMCRNPMITQWLQPLSRRLSESLGRREALTAVARQFGMRPRDVYAAIERARRP